MSQQAQRPRAPARALPRAPSGAGKAAGGTLRGVLTDWNDEKGFGFITPSAGGPRVFVHISAFPRGPRRPRVNDALAYTVGRDREKRVRAERVSFRRRSMRLSPRARGVVAALAVGAAFFALLGALVGFEYAPAGLLLAYAVASALTFGVYWLDKSAARNGRWRTEEATLHLFALAGGWPGALVAQQVFRHKTRKQPFQLLFRLATGVNCAAVAGLLFAEQAEGLREVLGFG